MSDEPKTNEEPDFLSQNGDALTDEERRAWFKVRAAEANEQGAVMARYSIHETIPNLALFEAWKVAPTSQGEQRWQLVPASSIRSSS